jgi:NAD(P)-dependent dehydrogenase (short-subunit alcohol dehydrogenase family)
VWRTVRVPEPSAGARFAGRRVLVADDTAGVAPALATRLAELGADATVVTAEGAPTVDQAAQLAAADTLVWLRPLHPDAALAPDRFDAPAAFAWWQPGLLGSVTTVLTVSTGGGTFAGNLTGSSGTGTAAMAKTVARELPGVTARAVDLDPALDPDEIAALLLAELADADGPVEVGYDQGQRTTRVAVAHPVDPDLPGSPRVELGPDSVVLLTGGARGITALAAVEIARRHRCRIELVGRSPLPVGDEPPELAAAGDRAAVRQLLLAAGELTTPAAIEAECSRLLGAREIRTTLAALADAGSEAVYHAADVRDPDALAGIVRDVSDRHGRLDLVVHGAGVLDDRFLRDKGADGFDRVFRTKVGAARTLLDATGDGTAVVFFGSVSGAFGNRGQIDYAAANATLDELATAHGAATGRTLVVDWGPWAGTGMVSAELEREYERRGVGLIDPGDGVGALLDELAAPPSAPQVIVMRASAAALAPELARFAPVLEGADA